MPLYLSCHQAFCFLFFFFCLYIGLIPSDFIVTNPLAHATRKEKKKLRQKNIFVIIF